MSKQYWIDNANGIVINSRDLELIGRDISECEICMLIVRSTKPLKRMKTKWVIEADSDEKIAIFREHLNMLRSLNKHP